MKLPTVRETMHPTQWDGPSNFVSHIDRDEYYDLLVVLTRTRDAGELEESNWRTALEMLGGESETVEIHRFGHWACGWWEALCVAPNSEAQTIAEGIVESLEDYPVLDEDDWSELENEEAQRVWADCYNDEERIAYMREHNSQFQWTDWADLRQQVRGECFTGYACELIQ